MSNGKIDAVYIKRNLPRISQGDIFYELSVILLQPSLDGGNEGNILKRTQPYAVVITQDCDLESDFQNRSEISPTKHDKYLPAILLCPAYLEGDFKDGTHLESLKYVMENHPTDRHRRIRTQQLARYHFIESDRDSVPNLVIDFKHYISVPREWIYRQYPDKYLISLNDLFRESLSQRFAFYLSRIGLPTIEKTPTNLNAQIASP